MAKFKCVHSGCVYELTEPEAIENMRKHVEYEEEVAILAPAVVVPTPVASVVSPKPKKVRE